MMKEEIAPALRRLGFKGSGQRYELPSGTHWAILGFQKSAYSDSADARFTINLTVVGRDEWEEARRQRPYIGERPKPSTYSGVGWESRIGQLMPGGEDRWWRISGDLPTEPVAGEVISAIEEFALPAMRARMPNGE
jgi:hypothetical protein